MHDIRRILVLVLLIGLPAVAADAPWETIARLERDIATAQTTAREAKSTLTWLGETLPAGADAALDTARSAVRTLTQATTKPPALVELETRYEAAAAERSARIDAVLATSTTYQRLLETQRTATATIQSLTARLTELSDDEARRYARARVDEDNAAGELYRIRKIYWERGEVRPAQLKADDLYKKIKASASGDDANKAIAQARNALREAQLAAASASERGKVVAVDLTQVEQNLEGLRSQLQAARQALQVTWTPHTVQRPAPVTAKAKAKAPDKIPMLKATVEIPAGCQQIRGILFSFMGTVHGDLLVRSVLAENGFALVTMDGLGIFTTEDDHATLLAFLDDLAAKSGHPELVNVPWLPAGCSTSTITARNMTAWKPERTIGVILWAGGNLHQHQSIPNWSLAGVPCLNINGEWEVFGPEGGIQPAYGRLTQWVMIREQIQRLRTSDPSHLFSLVILPGGDHAQWSSSLSPVAALFVRKAIRARLPAPPQPEGVIRCRPIDPASGSLTDPDLYDPHIPAAPVSTYTGSPATAFWHLDQDMAEAVDAFHRGKFFLPDPTREHPVPANWPPVRKPAPAPPAGSSTAASP